MYTAQGKTRYSIVLPSSRKTFKARKSQYRNTRRGIEGPLFNLREASPQSRPKIKERLYSENHANAAIIAIMIIITPPIPGILQTPPVSCLSFPMPCDIHVHLLYTLILSVSLTSLNVIMSLVVSVPTSAAPGESNNGANAFVAIAAIGRRLLPQHAVPNALGPGTSS